MRETYEQLLAEATMDTEKEHNEMMEAKMTFKGMLEFSQMLARDSLPSSYSIHRSPFPDRYSLFWHGHRLVANVDAEDWGEHQSRVDAGELLVGPAAYVAGGLLKVADGRVGLYRGELYSGEL